jgi:hypothetical protein
MHGCISSVFTIESNNLKKGIEMRYKRVSNFNKHDSQEAFVIEKQKQGYSIDEIVEQLRSNYDDLSEEDANEIIFKLINELQVTRGANKKRAIEIKINPGFKTVMTLNYIKSEISILVDNINDAQISFDQANQYCVESTWQHVNPTGICSVRAAFYFCLYYVLKYVRSQ